MGCVEWQINLFYLAIGVLDSPLAGADGHGGVDLLRDGGSVDQEGLQVLLQCL